MQIGDIPAPEPGKSYNPVDVPGERKLFETWWQMWCPGRDIPPHLFDAWLASARSLRVRDAA